MDNIRIYDWGNTRRFNSLADHLKRVFGGRVQKLSVNAGFTCPNRDGSKGTGGCTYCDSMAFSPSYCRPSIPVYEQLQKGIQFHKNRYRKAHRYLAYFQSYTNTYGDAGRLKDIYSEALSVDGVIGLVIGTRPDCIDDSILEVLEGLARTSYVVVEFGIESCFDNTLKTINRGHDFATTVEAISKTSGRRIITGGHMIFGLPGESREQMLSQASILSSLPLINLKFHQLQIVKNTVMASQYKEDPGMFNLFGPEEYIDFMAEFVARLSPSLIIERIAGEVPPRFIAGGERWGIRSDRLLSMFERRLEELDLWQGRYYEPINT